MSPRDCLAIALIFACRVESGTEPHDMGAAQHEQQAEREAVLAREHTDQTHERAAAGDGCMTLDRSRFGPVCWTHDSAEDHVRMADEHRQRAQRHRAASATLRQAEATACIDVPDDDRDTSPFAHRRDVRSVRAMEVSMSSKATAFPSRLVGAEIVFRAVPGMTAEWLQRVVDCHLARNAALGHAGASEDMPYCPLTLADVRADVRSTGDGFAVAVTADDTATATEILRRTRSLEGQVAP